MSAAIDLTDDQIRALCRAYGAKKVSDAAYAAMSGQRAAATAVGIPPGASLGVLYRITSIALPMMSVEDAAADAAQAAIGAAQIGRRPA